MFNLATYGAPEPGSARAASRFELSPTDTRGYNQVDTGRSVDTPPSRPASRGRNSGVPEYSQRSAAENRTSSPKSANSWQIFHYEILIQKALKGEEEKDNSPRIIQRCPVLRAVSRQPTREFGSPESSPATPLHRPPSRDRGSPGVRHSPDSSCRYHLKFPRPNNFVIH